MNSKEIKSIFDRFGDLNIMIIGDVMIDSYMWGRVERISPEAPIPIISVTKRESRPGGAANVALNVQSLGAKPVLLSVTGNDDRRELFFELMKEKGMDTSGILVSDDRKTTVKTRVISSNQQLLRVDEENSDKISRGTERKFSELIRSLITSQKIDAVIFEDYDKGVITPGIIKETIETAHKNNIPVAADPKKRNFSHYKDIDLFTPNLKEMAGGLKTDISRGDLEAIGQAAIKLQEMNRIRYLLITLSEMGIYLRFDNLGKLVPTEIRGVADVSGAGDTVISVAAACMAAGCSPEYMTMVANLAGGQVCEKVGVVPVDKQQLLEEILNLI
ncbi:MAG: bifunctional ADP-heptose synthase [Bacteroidales bacterium]